jgi:hypothetical protein
MTGGTRLKRCLDDSIHVADYPIRYGGCKFNARMTIVRLRDGSLWLHLRKARELFPDVALHICPGIEHNDPMLKFDWVLGDRPPDA